MSPSTDVFLQKCISILAKSDIFTQKCKKFPADRGGRAGKAIQQIEGQIENRLGWRQGRPRP
jgi:hypothetical protein